MLGWMSMLLQLGMTDKAPVVQVSAMPGQLMEQTLNDNGDAVVGAPEPADEKHLELVS